VNRGRFKQQAHAHPPLAHTKLNNSLFPPPPPLPSPHNKLIDRSYTARIEKSRESGVRARKPIASFRQSPFRPAK
jgi:hypothetical protein